MHYATTVNGKLLIASFCEELYISSVGRRTMLLRFIFLKAYSLSAEEPWAFPLHSGPKRGRNIPSALTKSFLAFPRYASSGVGVPMREGRTYLLHKNSPQSPYRLFPSVWLCFLCDLTPPMVRRINPLSDHAARKGNTLCNV
jgi:hypothetical protein